MAERRARDALIGEATTLRMLRRLDPLIEEILATAPPVTLYQIDSENASWINTISWFRCILSCSLTFLSPRMTQSSLFPNPPASELVQNYLEKSSNIVYKPPDSSISDHVSSSPLYFIHSIIPCFTVSTQYGAPLLAAFPPPNPLCSLVPNSDLSPMKKSTNAETINKEEVHKALTKAVMVHSFL